MALTVLVTGAHGYLGSHLVRALLVAGHRVRGLVSPWGTLERLADVAPQLELHRADIGDPDDLAPALAGVEVVVHAAAKVAEWGPWSPYHRANVLGTEHVVRAAERAGARRLVHVSSVAVHRYRGFLDADPRRAPLDGDVNAYARSKAEAERIVARATGVETVIVRPGAWPFGPGDPTLPRLLGALAGPVFPLVDGGRRRLNTAYVGNLVDGIALAATVPAAAGRIYLIADDGAPTWREVLAELARLAGLAPRWWPLPGALAAAAGSATEALWARLRPDEGPPIGRYAAALMRRDLHFSTEHARNELGHRPAVGWREGLARTVAAERGAGRWRRARRRADGHPGRSVTRPRIVVATIAAGGGHVATARAMAEAIEADRPGAYRVEVVEPMLALGFADLDARHKAQWRQMLAAPWTARWGQRAIDALPWATRAVLRRTFDGLARAAAAAYADEPPALIVVNHGFLAFAFGRARARYGLRAPLRVFATEPVDASALWAAPEADRFAVASRPAARDLVRSGVPADRVDVLGYPVQRAFLTPPTRAAARARLGLADRFTCLVSLGAEGVGGRAAAVVAALRSLPDAPQVVVVCGRNAALAEALRADARPGLVVRGQVDDMAAELAACDVVVGKGGPASVMEALAVGRPVLVTGVAGLNEVALLRFVVERGVGHDARRLADLLRHVRAYRASPEAGHAVGERSRGWGFPAMAARVGAYLVAAAGGAPRGDPSPGEGLA